MAVAELPHERHSVFIEGCYLCERLAATHQDVLRMESEMAAEKRFDTYEAPYGDREIGKMFPEIDWLTNLPPAERAWHGQYLERLIERYPDVPEWAWTRLLREPNA